MWKQKRNKYKGEKKGEITKATPKRRWEKKGKERKRIEKSRTKC